jgi:hypothetical protein
MADEAAGDSFEFVIITSQAADMAAVILDHIRHIMVEHESEDAAAAAAGGAKAASRATGQENSAKKHQSTLTAAKIYLNDATSL